MANTLFLRHLITAGTVCLALGPVKAEEKAMHLSKADKAFVMEAYAGGLAEIRFGRLAKTKATEPEAKTLAERLIEDHRKANEELKKMAEAKGIATPTEPGAEAQAVYKMLEKKEGSQFDKNFAENAVKDHKKDISAFEKIAKETKDEDLKAFVEKTVPVLKEHLALAKSAENKSE
jgi:putative membrane protein